jgi:hypothetical protein
MVHNRLTLRSLSATAVAVPMARPLGTSAQRIDIAPLLLIDLDTDEGVSGHAYAFCYLQSIARSLVPVVAELSAALAGLPLVPLDLSHRHCPSFQTAWASRPIGDGCLVSRYSHLGRARDGCRHAARDPSGRRSPAYPGLQQQRARVDVA